MRFGFPQILFTRTFNLRSLLRPIVAFALLLLMPGPQPGTGYVSAQTGGVLFQEDSPVSTDTAEGRLRVFDDAWGVISDRYYDRRFNGVDWGAQRRTYRDRAAAATGGAELYKVLREMISSLHDVHTRVFAPGESPDWRRPRFIGVGIYTTEIEGSLVVASVEHGSEAESAGLSPGDILKSVGDRQINVANALTVRDTAPKGRRASLYSRTNLFEGVAGSSVTVKWLDRIGTEHSAKLHRRWFTKTPGLRVTGLKDKTHLVSLDAFTSEIALDLITQFGTRLNNSRGIILDLRGNGGGETEAMELLASILLPPSTSIGDFYSRDGQRAAGLRTSHVTSVSARLLPSFSKPIVILTGGRTASAAEIFTAGLQRTTRAVVVGEQTCGCVLAIRTSHTLPDGGSLDVSEFDYRTSDGDRLEGKGITPDILVHPSIDDLREGRDRALEAAKQVLREKLRHD